ncbi:MAG TPA: hypothetical protein PKY82_02545 [Pyrinomonadaceae bacterium]|nr:hypothetical protein [Pyrinomonadaceae bacterium]
MKNFNRKPTTKYNHLRLVKPEQNDSNRKPQSLLEIIELVINDYRANPQFLVTELFGFVLLLAVVFLGFIVLFLLFSE